MLCVTQKEFKNVILSFKNIEMIYKLNYSLNKFQISSKFILITGKQASDPVVTTGSYVTIRDDSLLEGNNFLTMFNSFTISLQ